MKKQSVIFRHMNKLSMLDVNRDKLTRQLKHVRVQRGRVLDLIDRKIGGCEAQILALKEKRADSLVKLGNESKVLDSNIQSNIRDSDKVKAKLMKYMKSVGIDVAYHWG